MHHGVSEEVALRQFWYVSISMQSCLSCRQMIQHARHKALQHRPEQWDTTLSNEDWKQLKNMSQQNFTTVMGVTSNMAVDIIRNSDQYLQGAKTTAHPIITRRECLAQISSAFSEDTERKFAYVEICKKVSPSSTNTFSKTFDMPCHFMIALMQSLYWLSRQAMHSQVLHMLLVRLEPEATSKACGCMQDLASQIHDLCLMHSTSLVFLIIRHAPSCSLRTIRYDQVMATPSRQTPYDVLLCCWIHARYYAAWNWCLRSRNNVIEFSE